MRTVSDFPRRVVMHDPVWITMPDGARLAARIWLPDDATAQKVPAILEYLPYRRRDGTAVRDYLTHPYFAGHGYACVRVDMRGTGDSDGVMLDEYTQVEQDDCVEVIAWLARQPWCTGAVGMMGISWGGFNSLQVAALRPPALKAIISLCSTDDRYADDIHHMGGALLTDNLRWASTMFGYQSRPPDPEIVGERWREMWLERLHAEPLMLATWLRHQTRDAFWKHGSVCEAPERIIAATYLIGGWADGYSNAVPRMLERLTCPRKGLVGPWAHRYPHFAIPAPAIGFLQEALRWWDHWLKGRETGVMEGPQYRLWLEEYVPPATDYTHRPGRWVAEASWPSPRIAHETWRLGDHTLGGEPAPVAPIVIATPQNVGEMSGAWCGYGSGSEQPGDQRADDGLSVVFDSVPLAERLEIAGAAVLEATITADRPDALLIARLCDVAPDGASLRLSYGVLNLTHRDSHEHPAPLPVGQPVRVRLHLNDCAHAFPPGHRVRLALSTSYWPTVWPSPAPARLLLDAAASHLTLPHRPPSADDATLPPFAKAEGAPALPRTFLERPILSRTATHEQISGLSKFEVRDDTGKYRIDTTGLEYRLWSLDQFSIRADDPLSARGTVTFEMEQARGNWRVRAVTSTTLTATATDFVIQARLDAWEGDKRLVSRDWDVTIPRTHV
jgi:putative CocE/NonD family hydrolase